MGRWRAAGRVVEEFVSGIVVVLEGWRGSHEGGTSDRGSAVVAAVVAKFERLEGAVLGRTVGVGTVIEVEVCSAKVLTEVAGSSALVAHCWGVEVPSWAAPTSSESDAEVVVDVQSCVHVGGGGGDAVFVLPPRVLCLRPSRARAGRSLLLLFRGHRK